METITNIAKGAWHYAKRSWSYVKAYSKWSFGTWMGILGSVAGSADMYVPSGWKACKARWAAGDRFKAAAGLLVTFLGAALLWCSAVVLASAFFTVFIIIPLLLAWNLAVWGGIQLGIFSALFVMGLLTVKAGEWLLDHEFEGAFDYNWRGFGLSMPDFT